METTAEALIDKLITEPESRTIMTRKKPTTPLISDPVVEEVRRALWRSGGGTPEGFSCATSKIAKPRSTKKRPGSRKPTGKRAA